ncbi:unnamed protein product [Rhizoctonia solani]|uniref:Uncharacterized protein n=1 Tax=Rhizoctonia solani TaxID=456999 RepID=A0A8H3E640_9AGAM|nr:unnamed protein product [Rhizoctonia solani]
MTPVVSLFCGADFFGSPTAPYERQDVRTPDATLFSTRLAVRFILTTQDSQVLGSKPSISLLETKSPRIRLMLKALLLSKGIQLHALPRVALT